jgi:hypothetical protein
MVEEMGKIEGEDGCILIPRLSGAARTGFAPAILGFDPEFLGRRLSKRPLLWHASM